MMATSRNKATLGAVLLAGLLALGGTPAMAQGFGFSFGFGNSFDRDRDRLFPETITCMTDHQVRQAVADQGYTNISLNVPNGRRVQVRATRDGTVYLLRFNLCTGRIEDRDVLRRAQ